MHEVNYKTSGVVLSSKLSNALSNSMERKLNILNNAYKSKLERHVYKCDTTHTHTTHTHTPHTHTHSHTHTHTTPTHTHTTPTHTPHPHTPHTHHTQTHTHTHDEANSPFSQLCETAQKLTYTESVIIKITHGNPNDGYWRFKTDQEIHDILKGKNIIGFIKKKIKLVRPCYAED